MRPDPDDAEVKAFILTTTLQSYTGIARMLVTLFGRDRAWPVAMIRAERALSPRFGLYRYRDDPTVLAFILDRMGLMPLDKLMSQAEAAFEGRFPSRSQTHRIVSDLRQEAIEGAGATIPRKHP